MTLLFGKNAPTDLDLEDSDQLRAYLKKTSRVSLEGAELMLREILARQILEDNPPLVWETAQRLYAPPMARHKVMDQLSRALAPVLGAAVNGDAEGFDARYTRNLLALPVAEFDVENAVMALLSTDERFTFDDLRERIPTELGSAEPNEAVSDLIESVIDRMLESDLIELLAGDVVVAPEYVCRDIVLTTRVTDDAGWDPLETDFAGLGVLTDDGVESFVGASPGQLLLGRVGDDLLMTEPIPEPPVDGRLLDRIRLAYATEAEEAGLPLTFLDLTLRLLVDDPTSFDGPQLPLTELVVSAGLEIRGGLIADGPAAWRRLAHSKATFRIFDAADDEEQRRDLFDIYGLFERMDEDDLEVTASELRRVLDLLADERLLQICAEQFFGYDEDPGCLDATDIFARRLIAAASKPLQRSVAGVLTAMVAERRADPLVAADALADAVRQAPDFFPAVDRLAWTRSDQGRVAEAKTLWAQVVTPDDPDLAALESATGGQPNPGAGMRRNEPCWCGSGRKFKVCHLRANDLPPLPDRFTWLLRKNIAYLERRGAPLGRVVTQAAWKLADEDPDRVGQAMQEPLVLDLVLHELGWFDRFLAERGALLPEDEQLLFASWQLIPRTVYEIIGVTKGMGLKLRDLRMAEVTDVQEHTMSLTAPVGQMICARALPDGRGHQLVGAVISVPPGQEDAFLDAMDDPDPVSRADRLLEYMADASRPPELQTTTGEPLSFCTRVMSVEDPEWVRLVLDRHYVAAGADRWHQERPGDAGSLVLATLTLDGSTLTVETMSEYRFDDIVADLMELLPDAVVVSETIEPFAVAAARAPSEPAARDPLGSDQKTELTEWLSQREEQWCSESVPALGGLTPREAAGDPTQRERIIRLVDSFPPGGVTDAGVATMRPDRLRELLGI